LPSPEIREVEEDRIQMVDVDALNTPAGVEIGRLRLAGDEAAI